ncbi:hypothetical protein Tsubulata_015141 [Turnera subulata]|uniref:NAC domain-containing protein n=1 Tax=Turnera subulata TaxID=218843 RepID=A0A9Q0F319_9ROSI|nr:hypothetical protein Tsubulata_015141 [Turnera subulata]
MERPNFVVSGGVRLPIGYRFHPTDEELVVHYLKRKVIGLPLPASVIPELDVFQTDPWSLPGDLKEKRYFFSQKKGNDSETKCKRAAGSGYWKPVGRGKQIVASACQRPVGVRRTLVFCESKRSNQENRTHQWVMREYSLLSLAPISNATQNTQMKLLEGDWVVYSLFQRKRRPKKHGFKPKFSKINETCINEVPCPSSMDFTVEHHSFRAGPPQASPSCSSGITEIASNECLDQEEVSSFNSFCSYPFTRKD